MAQQFIIRDSKGRYTLENLLERINKTSDHLIVERDGSPVAVIISFQEYEHLFQPALVRKEANQQNLLAPMSLEEAFGSVTPLRQPEDFKALREAAIEEFVQKSVKKVGTG